MDMLQLDFCAARAKPCRCPLIIRQNYYLHIKSVKIAKIMFDIAGVSSYNS